MQSSIVPIVFGLTLLFDKAKWMTLQNDMKPKISLDKIFPYIFPKIIFLSQSILR